MVHATTEPAPASGAYPAAWLGLPRFDALAWFAVLLLDDNPRGSGSNRTDRTRPMPTSDFDTLREPTVELTRRDDQDGRARPPGA